MALSITHPFVSAIPDGADTSVVRPSNWNATHSIADLSAVSKLIGSGSASAAPTEITLGSNLTMTGTTLSASSGTNSGPTFPGGIPLTGVKYVSISGSNLPTGDNDLYTVPSGKRVAWIMCGVLNISAGNIPCFATINIGGTYYRLTSTVTPSSGAAQVLSQIGYIAEAGEKLSINTTTTNGLNVYARLIEFDDSCAVKTAKLTSLTGGADTVYTCPASTTALVLDSNMSWNTATLTSLYYVNSSGGLRTVIWYVVKSGQSVGSGYQSTPSNAVSDVSRSIGAFGGCLGAGDFIAIDSDAATATQMAWVSVMEIT